MPLVQHAALLLVMRAACLGVALKEVEERDLLPRCAFIKLLSDSWLQLRSTSRAVPFWL